jgi:hypothetical protein
MEPNAPYICIRKQLTNSKNSIMSTQIQFTRINNDVNGNPRYVCHFFNLLSEKEKYGDQRADGIDAACASLDSQYKLAVKKAKKLGGRKFSTKQYGGGIVFQSYNIDETAKQIAELAK